LRTIAELCGDEKHAKAISRLGKIQYYFSRPSLVLQLEKDDELILCMFVHLTIVNSFSAIIFIVDRGANNIAKFQS
jgi:hypothetical protein